MIELIDKRDGKFSIKEINSDFLIEYNGEICALKDLEVNGLKVIDVILKDDETILMYKRGIKS